MCSHTRCFAYYRNNYINCNNYNYNNYNYDMCIYAMCVTLQNVCLLARQDAQCRVGTTPNMTATQMVEHVLGTMKNEPAALAEKAVGLMAPANAMHTAGMMKKPVGMMKKPAGEMKKAVGEMKKPVGETKVVKNFVLKRPSAAAPCPWGADKKRQTQ